MLPFLRLRIVDTVPINITVIAIALLMSVVI